MYALSASRHSHRFTILPLLLSSHPPGSVSSYKGNVHISEYSCSCRCCGCSRPAISRESFHPVSFLLPCLFPSVKIFALQSQFCYNEWQRNEIVADPWGVRCFKSVRTVFCNFFAGITSPYLTKHFFYNFFLWFISNHRSYYEINSWELYIY